MTIGFLLPLGVCPKEGRFGRFGVVGIAGLEGREGFVVPTGGREGKTGCVETSGGFLIAVTPDEREGRDVCVEGAWLGNIETGLRLTLPLGGVQLDAPPEEREGRFWPLPFAGLRDGVPIGGAVKRSDFDLELELTEGVAGFPF